MKIIEQATEGWRVYRVVNAEFPDEHVDINEIHDYANHTFIYGVNWSGCGTLTTEQGNRYAELIIEAGKVADRMNAEKKGGE